MFKGLGLVGELDPLMDPLLCLLLLPLRLFRMLPLALLASGHLVGVGVGVVEGVGVGVGVLILPLNHNRAGL
eukprot:11830714-Heterocapsa_arctica.AAC.1